MGYETKGARWEKMIDMHQFFVKVLIVQKCPFNVFLMCNYQKLTTGPSENKLSSVNKRCQFPDQNIKRQRLSERELPIGESMLGRWLGGWVVTFHDQNPSRGKHYEHY